VTVQRFKVIFDKLIVVGGVLVEIMHRNGAVNVHLSLVCADPIMTDVVFC